MQALADKKKDVMDEDILALVSDEVHQPEKLWDVLDLQVAVLICTTLKFKRHLALHSLQLDQTALLHCCKQLACCSLTLPSRSCTHWCTLSDMAWCLFQFLEII